MDGFFKLVLGTPTRMIFWGILLVVFSFFLNHFFETNAAAAGKDIGLFSVLATELLRDFGIALWVAAAIHFSVEMFASKEREKIFRGFAREADDRLEIISENTLSSFFKKDLPDGWFEFLRDQINAHDFIRSDLNVDVEIKYPTEDMSKIIDESNLPEKVVYSATLSYVITNISKENSHYKIKQITEFPVSDALREFTQITDLKINGDTLALDDLKKADDNWADVDNHKKLEHSVLIPKGGSIEVQVSCETLKLHNDAMVWVCMQPSFGAKFRISAPKEFVLTFGCVHPSFKGSMSKVSVDGSPIFQSINDPIPPFTCAEVRWIDKKIVGKKYLQEA